MLSCSTFSYLRVELSRLGAQPAGDRGPVTPNKWGWGPMTPRDKGRARPAETVAPAPFRRTTRSLPLRLDAETLRCLSAPERRDEAGVCPHTYRATAGVAPPAYWRPRLLLPSTMSPLFAHRSRRSRTASCCRCDRGIGRTPAACRRQRSRRQRTRLKGMCWHL